MPKSAQEVPAGLAVPEPVATVATVPGAPAQEAATGSRPPRGVAGTLPYFAFVAIFLIIPVLANLLSTFRVNGRWSIESMARVFEQQYLEAFVLTINLSVLTAVVGGVFGLVLAWAMANADRPRWLKSIVSSYSALASQSGGVPLAFAFIATLGAQGLITMMADSLAPGLMDDFRLDSFWGVALVYLYFQVPLMAILMLPAMGGLKHEWHEAATSLGASTGRYLKDVALPVLWPSIVGSLLLLFANSFSAYATAYALAGGGLNLVPILIGFFLSGNVMLDESFAAALVTGMMVIVVAAMGLRALLERRSSRWLDQ